MTLCNLNYLPQTSLPDFINIQIRWLPHIIFEGGNIRSTAWVYFAFFKMECRLWLCGNFYHYFWKTEAEWTGNKDCIIWHTEWNERLYNILRILDILTAWLLCFPRLIGILLPCNPDSSIDSLTHWLCWIYLWFPNKVIDPQKNLIQMCHRGGKSQNQIWNMFYLSEDSTSIKILKTVFWDVVENASGDHGRV